MNGYVVKIVEKKTGYVIDSIRLLSLDRAQRVQRGASINLNQEKYKVEVSLAKAVSQ